MTRKEAMIHTLVKENDELKTEIGRLRQALEQKSCKDTISREAVLKEIPALWNSNGDKDYCMESLRDFVTELPPVTPAHKVGKWIYVGRPNGMSAVGTNVYQCSVCGREIGTKYGWKTVGNEFPFCHCGADMRGSGDDSN